MDWTKEADSCLKVLFKSSYSGGYFIPSGIMGEFHARVDSSLVNAIVAESLVVKLDGTGCSAMYGNREKYDVATRGLEDPIFSCSKGFTGNLKRLFQLTGATGAILQYVKLRGREKFFLYSLKLT